MTYSTFLEKIKQKGFTKFTYVPFTEVKGKGKITIVCPIHGKFTQRIDVALSKEACPHCSNSVRRKSPDMFIHELEQLGTFYDYTKTKYIKQTEKVIVTCKKHGDFTALPSNLLKGAGCKQCGLERLSKTKTKSTEVFIKEASKVHNNYYSYENTIYTHNKVKVLITCPIHGNFEQNPLNHLKGCGCTGCASYGYDFTKPAILYYLYLPNEQIYKIGITNRTIKERFYPTELPNIVVLDVISYKTGKEAFQAEYRIKSKFKSFKYKQTTPLKIGNSELYTTPLLPEVLNEKRKAIKVREWQVKTTINLLSPCF